MGKKKAIVNFNLYKSSLKSCPRIKVKCLRNLRHTGFIEGKIYNIENDTPQGYWIINEKGELLRLVKDDFELLNNGLPIKDEDIQMENKDKQTTIPK